jgi:hypothetical protein
MTCISGFETKRRQGFHLRSLLLNGWSWIYTISLSKSFRTFRIITCFPKGDLQQPLSPVASPSLLPESHGTPPWVLFERRRPRAAAKEESNTCATCALPISLQQYVTTLLLRLWCTFANECETPSRSAYDVMFATTTTSAYNASQMDVLLTITTQPRTRSTSLSKTHFRSTIKIGELMRSCCF